MIQFGDITNHNGTGGLSIYGGKFEDENFDIKHTKRGQLSMANAGPNTNGSQVFVTFCPCPHLDGRHVVFGEISKGKGLLRRLENIQTGENDYPTVDVRIVDSGLVKEGEDDGVPPLSIGEHEVSCSLFVLCSLTLDRTTQKTMKQIQRTQKLH